MKNKNRKNYPQRVKISVGIEMIKGDRTVAEICSEYGIHATQAHNWKKKALLAIETSFDGNPELKRELGNKQSEIDELYRQLGKSQMELEWLKKKMGYTN